MLENVKVEYDGCWPKTSNKLIRTKSTSAHAPTQNNLYIALLVVATRESQNHFHHSMGFGKQILNRLRKGSMKPSLE